MVEVHGWLLFEIASLGYSIDSFEPFEQQQIAIQCKASLNALVPWRRNNVLFRVMYSWFALTHVSLVDICVIVYVFISARQSQSTMLKPLDHVFVSSLRWRCRRWRIFSSMSVRFPSCGPHWGSVVSADCCLRALSPEDFYFYSSVCSWELNSPSPMLSMFQLMLSLSRRERCLLAFNHSCFKCVFYLLSLTTGAITWRMFTLVIYIDAVFRLWFLFKRIAL